MEHDDDDSRTMKMAQRDSSNDDLTDLNMEVDEEADADEETESAYSTDDEINEGLFENWAAPGGQNMEHMHLVVSNVVGGVSDFGDENGNLFNKHWLSVSNQTDGNTGLEYDSNVRFAIKDNLFDVETHRRSNMAQTKPAAEPRYAELQCAGFIKQELNTDFQVSHDVGQGCSQHTKDYQPSNFSAIHLQKRPSYKVRNFGHMTKVPDANNSRKRKKTLTSIHEAKTTRSKAKEKAKLFSANSVDCCLVCNAPCFITENRKIPSLPFCKKCKKAYFYQLAHRYTPGNVYRNGKCTAGGNCKIDYRLRKICPKCHHIKFLAVIKASQKAFKKPFKLNNSEDHEDIDYEERNWSVIRDKMLLQEALRCQPVVSLERLDTNELSTLDSRNIQNSYSIIKQEPLDSSDPCEHGASNCLQPLNEPVTGLCSDFLVTPKLPDMPLLTTLPENCYKRPVGRPRKYLKASPVKKVLHTDDDPRGQGRSYCLQQLNELTTGVCSDFLIKSKLPDNAFLTTLPENCYKRPVGRPRSKFPKALPLKTVLPTGNGKSKKIRKSVRKKLSKKTRTENVGGTQHQRCKTRGVMRDRGTVGGIRARKIKDKIGNKTVTLTNLSGDSWSIVDAEDSSNLTTHQKNMQESVSGHVNTKSRVASILTSDNIDVLKQSTDLLLITGSCSRVNVNTDSQDIHHVKEEPNVEFSDNVAVEPGNSEGYPIEGRSNKADKSNSMSVSVFNCGHACSKCNSTETRKWLEDHEYAVNNPLSIVVNNDQLVFEGGTASCTALVFQKLCEINQLLQGKSKFYFDPKTGTLKFKSDTSYTIISPNLSHR